MSTTDGPSSDDVPGGPAGRRLGQWIVWRQDDNGNRFEVARLDSRAEAEQLAATYEARAHKQIYWVTENSE